MYKTKLSADEMISLKHLIHYLGHYDRYLFAPRGLPITFEGFAVRRFDDGYFASIAGYSRLLLSREFYEAFSDYQYILIYQLDALVLADQLLQWCNAGYDYIGAPWLKARSAPEAGFSRCGNGGFSLRRVRSFLDVIDSQRYLAEPVSYIGDVLSTSLQDLDELTVIGKLVKRLRVFRQIRRGVAWYMSNYTLNEDHFWSDRARLFYPKFKIAPVDVALRFSFEYAPRCCFEQNGHQLPFGCHAWSRWDREFWQPHLLPNEDASHLSDRPEPIDYPGEQ